MKKYYGKKLLITTCCMLAITAFSGCSKKMGQVEATKEPEVKQEVDVEVKPLEYTTHPLPTEEPDLPTVPSFNSKEDEKEFKLLKQDISVYIKNEYETPKEHVEGIVKNLNEWDVAGVSDAFYGVYEYPEGEYVINGYSDSLQEEWNKVKGTVTYEELGLIETYKTGNPLMEYKIIFDIEEPGNLNLNKGENVRYLYIMLVSLDEDDSDYESVAGIDLMRYERIKEYDYLANYDDISSFGIGMSDEWYEKKINEDIVAVKADPNRDYSIDLDGDGKSEKISMSAVYEEYNYKTEGEPFIDYRRENKFYCDDKKVEELGLYSGEFESGNYATEGFYIIDIDNWDQYKEIAVEYYYNMNYDPSAQPSLCIYRYIDGKFVELGMISGYVVEGKEYNTLSGFNGDGVIELDYELDGENQIFSKCRYAYSSENKELYTLNKWLYPNTKLTETINMDFDAFNKPEDSAGKVTLKAGEKVTFLARDVGLWSWYQKEDGTKFYLKLNDEGSMYVENNSQSEYKQFYEVFVLEESEDFYY